jgi:hypothetical protein
MENQHRKIKGYRELSEVEIQLMNEIKQKGEELRDLVNRIDSVIQSVPAAQDGVAYDADHPSFWLRYADGSFRTAIMYAVRAVAQPTSY